uniref:DDE_Tnp_1_7 domain-containing protein n=1 Tax=Strongyloides venezuelensis TaxID=75913 RepID=A0A0K0FKY9_STRVS
MSINSWNLPATEVEAITFLTKHSLVPKERICAEKHKAKLYTEQRILWNCFLRSYSKKTSLENGMWFSNSSLDFSKELVSIKFCEEQLQMSYNATTNWSNFMREVCVGSMKHLKTQKIGEPGKIVEIDESFFLKRKNNSSRILLPVWTFGGVCRETGECFLTTDSRRETIYSVCWLMYRTGELEAKVFGTSKLTKNPALWILSLELTARRLRKCERGEIEE